MFRKNGRVIGTLTFPSNTRIPLLIQQRFRVDEQIRELGKASTTKKHGIQYCCWSDWACQIKIWRDLRQTLTKKTVKLIDLCVHFENKYPQDSCEKRWKKKEITINKKDIYVFRELHLSSSPSSNLVSPFSNIDLYQISDTKRYASFFSLVISLPGIQNWGTYFYFRYFHPLTIFHSSKEARSINLILREFSTASTH